MSRENMYRLTQVEFFHLATCVQTNRDGVEKQTSWTEASDFLKRKMKEVGHTFEVSIDNVKSACHAAGVRPSFPAATANPAKVKELAKAFLEMQEQLKAVIELGSRNQDTIQELQQLSSMLAADASALRFALVSVCQKTGIRPPAECGLVIADNGKVSLKGGTNR